MNKKTRPTASNRKHVRARGLRSGVLLAAGAALVALAAAHVHAAETPIKIALIADKTGPLEAYAKQTSAGFAMGLDYATGGTMMVEGHKLIVIEKDSQTKPDVGRNLLNEAYNDDGADIAVGGTSSAVALAMLPVAQDNKKIFIVEPAVADSITGDKWNRYIFRTGRNSTPGRGLERARHRQTGHGDRDAGAGLCLRPRLRHRLQDGAGADRRQAGVRGIRTAADDRFHRAHPAHLRCAGQGAGPQDHFRQLGRRRIRWRRSRRWARSGWASRYRPAATSCRRWSPTRTFPGLEGAAYYYYDIPKNPVNDALVAENKKRFNGAPPDFFTCGGFIAAQAVVLALKKTGGSTDPEKLIAAMEGMAFDSPKDTVLFRKEDHQLLQPMYAFKIKVDPNVPWAIPELTHVITMDEMKIPIANKR